jgi:replicative DNA helicase
LLLAMVTRLYACEAAEEAGLRAEMFSTPVHQAAFAALQATVAEIGQPDIRVVVTRMAGLGVARDVAESLFGDAMTLIQPAPRAGTWAKIVRDQYSDRRVGAMLDDVRSVLNAGRSGDEVRTALEEGVWRLRGDVDVQRRRLWADEIDGVWGAVDAGPVANPRHIDVPWLDLDPIMHGCDPGQLIIIAGRPGSCKSALAQNWAQHVVSEGSPVLYLSLEMPPDELVMRGYAMAAKVPFDAIKARKLTPSQRIRFDEARAEIREWPMFTEYPRKTGFAQLETAISRHVHEHGVRIAFIDHAQRIRAGHSWGGSKTHQMTEIVEDLKDLALMLDTPIVLLSQLNRENEKRADKRPQSSDLKETGALEENADKILLLHRPDLYGDDAATRNEVEVNVSKHRSGQPGKCSLHYQGSYYRLLDRSTREVSS